MSENQNKIIAPPPKDGVWDVLIIGSGPAALTAAIYTTRGAASTLILGGENWGGQLMLTTEVDNFPAHPGILGPELMQKMHDHALMFGAKMELKNVDEVAFNRNPFELKAGGEIYKGKSVIIATGADTRWLDIPGEEKLRGRGVSSCAPCDAPFFKNKKVVVIGGGDSAMEEALVLTKYASEVTIIHRRDTFKASEAMQQKVKAAGINILWNTEIKEFIGDQKLEKIKLFNTKENKESEFTTDGAFVAIGHTPASEIFKGFIDVDEKGYIKKEISEKGFHSGTAVPGIFIAGDVHDYIYRQAITAAGFGCQAAMDALKYLDKSGPAW